MSMDFLERCYALMRRGLPESTAVRTAQAQGRYRRGQRSLDFASGPGHHERVVNQRLARRTRAVIQSASLVR